MGRKEDDDKYQEFLREPDEEKKFRDKVLKPGVIHTIHLSGDADKAGRLIDLSDTPAAYGDEPGHTHSALGGGAKLAAVLGTL